MRDALEYLINRARMSKGMPCSEKAYPLSREQVIQICEYLYRINDVSDLPVIAQLTMSWQAIGRSNEVVGTVWNSFYYDDSTKALHVDWNQFKTGKQDTMSFYNDKDSFEADPLMAMAGYIVASDKCLSIEDEGSAMYVFRKDKSDVSKYLLKHKHQIDCLKHVDNSKISATSLRIGASNQAVENPTIQLYDLVARGGWSFSFMKKEKNKKVASVGAAADRLLDIKKNLPKQELQSSVNIQSSWFGFPIVTQKK